MEWYLWYIVFLIIFLIIGLISCLIRIYNIQLGVEVIDYRTIKNTRRINCLEDKIEKV